MFIQRTPSRRGILSRRGSFELVAVREKVARTFEQPRARKKNTREGTGSPITRKIDVTHIRRVARSSIFPAKKTVCYRALFDRSPPACIVRDPPITSIHCLWMGKASWNVSIWDTLSMGRRDGERGHRETGNGKSCLETKEVRSLLQPRFVNLLAWNIDDYRGRSNGIKLDGKIVELWLMVDAEENYFIRFLFRLFVADVLAIKKIRLRKSRRWSVQWLAKVFALNSYTFIIKYTCMMCVVRNIFKLSCVLWRIWLYWGNFNKSTTNIEDYRCNEYLSTSVMFIIHMIFIHTHDLITFRFVPNLIAVMTIIVSLQC